MMGYISSTAAATVATSRTKIIGTLNKALLNHNIHVCLPPPPFPGAISYGLCSILLLTPLLGLLAVQLPLQPPALALGLGVFCAMPTALSSGITFTQVSTGEHCWPSLPASSCVGMSVQGL